MSGQQWLTAHEAATYSRLSVHTIRDAAAAGELTGAKTSLQGRWLFTTDDIDTWLDAKRADLRRRLVAAHPTTELRRRLNST